MFWQCSKCLRWPIIIIIIIIIAIIIIIIILSFFKFSFFFQWFYYKNERETNDDTYELLSNFKEKKTNENTNVTEILSLESVVQPFSTLHSPCIPFWGIVKWRLPLCQKKKNFKVFFLFFYYYFYFLKWNNGITRLFK